MPLTNFGSIAPNQINFQYTPGDTGWHRINVASGAAWPNLPTGLFPQGIQIKSVATGGVADGGNFQVAYNLSVAPTVGLLVDGAGNPDGHFQANMIWNVWVKMATGTDLLDCVAYY